jgi:hypothetical protein
VLCAFSAAANPAGPWPDPWVWDGSDKPHLTLLLGGAAFLKTLPLPAKATDLELTLKKYTMTEDGVSLEWRAGGKLWLQKNKKIPGSQSTETVPLPPGSVITLRVSTRSGQLLAEITLQRK